MADLARADGASGARERHLQLQFVLSSVPERHETTSLRGVSSDGASDGVAGGDLSTAELWARMARNVAGDVRPSDLPTEDRLATLLEHHVEAGELERVGDRWRLTPLGREVFGRLNDPNDERKAA